MATIATSETTSNDSAGHNKKMVIGQAALVFPLPIWIFSIIAIYPILQTGVQK